MLSKCFRQSIFIKNQSQIMNEKNTKYFAENSYFLILKQRTFEYMNSISKVSKQ